MKIIALPDLHNNLTSLSKISNALVKADLVLLVGDLANGDSALDADQLINSIQKFNTSILAIPGNWDGPNVDHYLSDLGINLNRKHRIIDKLAFIGIGASLPGIIQTPWEFEEQDFERFFEEATTGLDAQLPQILVCHQPPYNTKNDLAQGKSHVGSKAVRAFIEHRQPLVCFTGHIHEGKGIDEIGITKIINPGPFSEGSYAYAEVTQKGIQTLEIVSMNP